MEIKLKKKQHTELWKSHKGQPLSLPILFSNALRMKLEIICRFEGTLVSNLNTNQVKYCYLYLDKQGFPDTSVGKESAYNTGDPGLIPGSGRSAGEGIGYPLQYSWASHVAQLVKNPPAIWETRVRSLGWEDPLEKGKATHSSILAWRILYIKVLLPSCMKPHCIFCRVLSNL